MVARLYLWYTAGTLHTGTLDAYCGRIACTFGGQRVDTYDGYWLGIGQKLEGIGLAKNTAD